MSRYLLLALTLLSLFLSLRGFPQKGISIFPINNPPLDSPQTLESLQKLKSLGVNWLSLVVTWNQDNQDTTAIYPSPGTPSDQVLLEFLQKAKSLGFDIMLKPHIDPKNIWRAWIGQHYTQRQWDEWFDGYTRFITHYAAIAERGQCKQFCAGVEYVIPSTHATQWRQVVSAIRKVFSGTVTYAANWGGLNATYGPEIDAITWIDVLDLIGIDAYYPLTNLKYPTYTEILNGWDSWLYHIRNITNFWKKDVIFTEIGYRSIDGATIQPGDWQITSPPNMTQQADAYEATLKKFYIQPWWQGIFFWAWSTDPNYGGLQNTDYTPNGKPAEQVLSKYYHLPDSKLGN